MANWMLYLGEEYIAVMWNYLHELLYRYHVIQAIYREENKLKELYFKELYLKELYLKVFLIDGDVPMDNIASERAIRGAVSARRIGRSSTLSTVPEPPL